jgi:hypothetical protein
MPHRRVSLPMCAALVALLLGCDQGANQDGQNEATASSCAIIGTSAWWNQGFTDQTGIFEVELVAVPSAPNIDAVIGFSNGPASRWTNLATIIRFNPQGKVDVRAGAEYKADVDLDYTYLVERALHFRMQLDVTRRIYSVWYNLYDGEWKLLAREYPFRTEQASVTRLNNVASFVNPQTGAGSVQVCGLTISSAPAAPDPNCMTSVAGSGFANKAITASSGALIVGAAAVPRLAFMDGVVGVANGDVDAYDDLATAVRFWTNGKIEARDGDRYRADADITYVPGETYSFTFVIDRPSKMYSVYVETSAWETAKPLGHNYRFRPQQLAVTQLDRVSSIVASASGRVDVCSAQNTARADLRTALAGHHQVLPLADDGALLSDGARTHRLASDGSIMATIPAGGSLAQDSAGNVYIARITNGTFVVDSYTQTMQLRWSRIYGTHYARYALGDVRGVDGGGIRVVISRLDSNGTVPEQLVRISSDGLHSIDNLGLGSRAALGRDRLVTLAEGGDEWHFIAYAYSGQQLWHRVFPKTFWPHAMTVGPDGSFILAGEHWPGTNFGDGELEWWPSPEGPYNTFVAVFDADGATRFSRRMAASSVTGVSTNGQRIALSLDSWTQFPYPMIATFDAQGLGGAGMVDVGFGEHGLTYGVAIATSNRLWFGLYAALDFPPWSRFPMIVTLDPR